VSRRRRFHIGFHFFGSGNIGDDFMLAGFLDVAREMLGAPLLTCCSPFDRDAQRLRFGEVTWLPYEARAREEAVAAADAWIGVGDSPFQSEVGSWFFDHLVDELELCRRFRKPMFYFCVGVNDRAAMQHPVTRTIAAAAAGIWTRDRQSAALVGQINTGAVLEAADLANVFLASRTAPAVEPGTIGFLLNFEDRAAFSAGALCEVLDATSPRPACWLVQEVRTLSGSEWELLTSVPSSHRSRLEVRAPVYSKASLTELAGCWGSPETIVTSRYHGALVAAWSGARVVVIERNAKLTGLVEQLGLTSVPDLQRAEPLLEALQMAQPVEATRLHALTAAVRDAGRQLAGRWSYLGL
jgi:polysaccharide pyruvyl transferase WcaK-like protein